jgi:hypothetical protein
MAREHSEQKTGFIERTNSTNSGMVELHVFQWQGNLFIKSRDLSKLMYGYRE